jgi:hypothetical protein
MLKRLGEQQQTAHLVLPEQSQEAAVVAQEASEQLTAVPVALVAQVSNTL